MFLLISSIVMAITVKSEARIVKGNAKVGHEALNSFCWISLNLDEHAKTRKKETSPIVVLHLFMHAN